MDNIETPGNIGHTKHRTKTNKTSQHQKTTHTENKYDELHGLHQQPRENQGTNEV